MDRRIKDLEARRAEAKRQMEKREQINEREQRISAREAKALEKQLRKEYEQTQEQAEKLEASNVLKKHALTKLYNEGARQLMAERNEEYANTLNKVRRFENVQKQLRKQQAFNDLLSTLKEHKDWKFFKSLAKPADVEHTRLPSGISPLQEAEDKRIEELINQSMEKQEELEINKRINKLQRQRRESELSEADTVELESLIIRRADFGKRRMPYRVPKNYKAAEVIENAYVNRLARQEMKRLKSIREAQGQGLRGRIHPKKRTVKVSKNQLLKNRLALITSEIKAGNDNPKLIVEMDKLYKQLYNIDNAHLHFKK